MTVGAPTGHSNNRPNIIRPVVTDPREHIRSLVSPLCEPLHEAFEWSADQAHRRRGDELAHDRYNWLGTHLTRAFAHRRLVIASDLAASGWKVTGNHGRNGELWLARGMTTLRVLHTNSARDVPRAGHNGARRAYYRNVPLFDVPGQGVLDFEDCSRLLALWRVTNPATFEISIRVVRTLDEGTPGRRSELDFDLMLPRTADDMTDLEWFPSDDLGIDLPGDDENEEGTGDADGLLG